MDIISYVLSKKYVDESLAGAGALKGVPCQIQSITPITGGNRITFLWKDNDGNEHTSTLDVMNGINGAKGDKGDKGDRGEQGEQGIQGAQGIQGIQGIQGVKGDTGATGAQGIQGIQGIQGEKGDDGYPFLIYKQYDDISEFSESDFPEIGLMFMVMQEDFDPEDPSTSIGYPIYRYTGEGNPPYSLVVHLASQGIKGEKGDKGDTGAQGIQGEKGDKGDKGDTGAQGAQGIQGVQGEQGVGVPDGGTTGQALVKLSDNDYDFGFKDTADTVRPNSHALVESGAVYNAINQALDSVYTPRGDLTCAELTSSLLIEANVGNIYQMSDSGTTSALFIQGAGQTINANDNVGIVKAGADIYLFNLMGNAFDLHDYQKKDLTTPITVGGQSQTTVEGALGGINGVIPASATSDFKLLSMCTPYNSFTLNNNSGSQKWYKLGNYGSGHYPARLDFVSARVDGQMFESSIRISGDGSDNNYVSWVGEKGCEISTISVKVDSSRNIYAKMNSYSAVEIRVYGTFTLSITEPNSEPSGTGVGLQKLVTESDLNPVAITTPTPVSGVTGGDGLIYGFKSGKMVTIVLNGIIMANNIAQNQPIFKNVPTVVGYKNIYFTVLDYENGKLAVMSIIGDSLAAAFQSDDKSAVHAGRYWGTVTYMTSD